MGQGVLRSSSHTLEELDGIFCRDQTLQSEFWKFYSPMLEKWLGREVRLLCLAHATDMLPKLHKIHAKRIQSASRPVLL